MSYTKVVVVMRGHQDLLDNILIDLFDLGTHESRIQYQTQLSDCSEDLPNVLSENHSESQYHDVKHRFSRGYSCSARIRYREQEAVVLDIISPWDLHLYYDLLELSERYEGLIIDYWESNDDSVSYRGQILAGTELYRIDTFYPIETKHEALGKSIRIRVAHQMTQELAEKSNFKDDLAKAFTDADIPIPFGI